MPPPLERLLLITDPVYDDAHIDAVIAAVANALPGVLAVQLREKGATPSRLSARARTLRALTASCGAALIVNGEPEVAAEVDADGVHVPGFTEAILARVRGVVGPSRSIYVPVHTKDEVELALDAGADAILVSPIFDSPGKGPARGVGALAEARELASRHVRAGAFRIYALGGVDATRAPACHRGGADGVAIIRAVLGAADPVATAKSLVLPWLTAS